MLGVAGMVAALRPGRRCAERGSVRHHPDHHVLSRRRGRIARDPGPALPIGIGHRRAHRPSTAGDGMRSDASPPPDSWGEPRTRTVSWWDPMVGARAMRGLSGREYLQAMIDGRLPQAPIGGLIAMTAVSVGEGTVAVPVSAGRVGVQPHRRNPRRTRLHTPRLGCRLRGAQHTARRDGFHQLGDQGQLPPSRPAGRWRADCGRAGHQARTTSRLRRRRGA
jgi:hypothetical protein